MDKIKEGGGAESFELINKKDAKDVALKMAGTFLEDPLYKWFFPNGKTRLRKTAFFLEYELREKIKNSYRYGEAGFIISDGAKSRVPFTLVLRLVFNIGFKGLFRSVSYLSFCNKMKAKYKPENSEYISVLCVLKEYRGRGIARGMIEKLASKTTFLETQNPQNVAFYEKLGFKLVAEAEFKNGIRHYCFLR